MLNIVSAFLRLWLCDSWWATNWTSVQQCPGKPPQCLKYDFTNNFPPLLSTLNHENYRGRQCHLVLPMVFFLVSLIHVKTCVAKPNNNQWELVAITWIGDMSCLLWHCIYMTMIQDEWPGCLWSTSLMLLLSSPGWEI